MPRRKVEPIRILFKPKGRVDATLTDASYHSRIDTSKHIADASHLRCRSSDMSTPRYVAGEHKGIKAEGYYATRCYDQKALDREQEKGRSYY